MIIILFIVLLPAMYLTARIALILSKNIWGETECEVISIEIVNKGRGPSELLPPDAPCHYLSIKYKYSVQGKEFTSSRISLDLVDRGYRPIEIEHDPFIQYVKSGACRAYYCKYLPKLAVITKETHHAASNLAMLLIYITVVMSSYVISLYWPKR
jgi:hypothetical protein